MKNHIVATLFACVVAPALALAGITDLTPAEKASEFHQIAALMRTTYGPLEYKRSTLKVNLDVLVADYAIRAQAASNIEFYYLVNQFIAEFHDSHFGSGLQTDHVSKLGFETERVQGKVVIDTIDRTVLSEKDFPFEKGDEIVSIGRKTAEDTVRELASYGGSGNPDAALIRATWGFSHRPSTMFPPQSGKTTLTIQRRKTGEIVPVTIPWIEEGSPVEELPPLKWSETRQIADYMNLDVDDYFQGFPKGERAYRCSGISRVKRPVDAVVLVETPFVAYYHDTPKGKVGYLRIPHYNWQNAATGQKENDLRFKQYEYAIEEFERNTIGIVIDQTHNCGGSVQLVEDMVGLFADKPFTGLQFQFLANRKEYLEFKAYLNKDQLVTIDGLDLKKVLDLIKTTWLKGDFLTPKTTFHADRLLHPNRIRYTKPVLVLVDELAGSGGDAFPAMMQGLGRAKIMGKRTMGAGGHVVEVGALNYSANKVRITKSLFYHPNGKAIENNGVDPDFPYEITMNDFLGEYQEYQKAYLDTLLSMVP